MERLGIGEVTITCPRAGTISSSGNNWLVNALVQQTIAACLDAFVVETYINKIAMAFTMINICSIQNLNT
jgi:hypothetical protein